jgi:hypothetical protein
MIDMANDSHLFRTREQLEAEGYELEGNVFVRGGERYLPLYEAKMIWHFDHRFGDYAGVTSRYNTELPTPSDEQHADPFYVVQPLYWIYEKDIKDRAAMWRRLWFVGWRRITNASNERTAICAVVPYAAVNDGIALLLPEPHIPATLVAGLLGNLSSIVFDLFARYKVAGVHLDFHHFRQLPVLPPSVYPPNVLLFIVPRVLELIYTAWDMKPFADDVWHEADEALRAAIWRQWADNARCTGGHQVDMPAWAHAYPHITPANRKALGLTHIGHVEPKCPLPPFRWDESRRGLLKAELDAYYAHLYGLTRKQLRYILDPADLTEREIESILDDYEEVSDPVSPHVYYERCARSRFPGETFRVLKEKEQRYFGEYRTRRLVLEAWERLHGGSP